MHILGQLGFDLKGNMQLTSAVYIVSNPMTKNLTNYSFL